MQALRITLNQAKKAHHQAGINARQAKQEQKKKIAELQIKKQSISIELIILIHNSEKNSTLDKLKVLQLYSLLIQALSISISINS